MDESITRPPPREPFVDKGRRRTPREQAVAERVWAEARSSPPAASQPANSRVAAPDWIGAAIALMVVGLLLVILGLILLIPANSIFVGILGGALFTAGMSWVAVFLGFRALRER